jgi:cell division protein FtsW (lipid II flippase)
MLEALYDGGDNALWTVILVTCVMGGGAAFVSGRAIAQTWRPFWHVPLYMLGLALVVRFWHFALFDEPFLSRATSWISLWLLSPPHSATA